jgi:hypothetical protein
MLLMVSARCLLNCRMKVLDKALGAICYGIPPLAYISSSHALPQLSSYHISIISVLHCQDIKHLPLLNKVHIHFRFLGICFHLLI